MIQELIEQILMKQGHSDNSYSVELLQIIQFESKTKSIQILATKWIELTKTRLNKPPRLTNEKQNMESQAQWLSR